jgi:RimJ/RimL family protein N-acetyltransferase
MQGKLIARTERLFIREFTATDATFIISLLNSPGWLKYIGDRKVTNNKEALKYLHDGPFTQYAERQFGLWKVELKEKGETIGMCGLLKRASLELPDIGFAFLPQYSGSGYALESAFACMNFAHEFGIQNICAITLPENKSSISLLNKLGMHFERQLTIPPGDELLHLYVGETKKKR